MTLSIYDIAYNPLGGGASMTMTGFQTLGAEDQTLGLDIYRFMLNSIRVEDQLGNKFLERYLIGPQTIWERMQLKIFDLQTLYDPIEIDARWLKYLKNIVGWTDDLNSITDKLETDSLRRLIRSSVALWKRRGIEKAITDLVLMSTTARLKINNWFDFRWILEETGFGEEMEDHDSWLIDNPGMEASERWSNLRIVDDGSLDHELIRDIVKLMRPVGERYDISYISFLDQFEVDGDDSQWILFEGFPSSLTVKDGTMVVGEVEDGGIAVINVDGAYGWNDYVFKARMKTTGALGAFFYLPFYLSQDQTKYIGFAYDFSLNAWQVFGTEFGSIASGVLLEPLRPEVYYTFKVEVTSIEVADAFWITVWIDNEKIVDVVAPALGILAGTAGCGGVALGGITVSEAELFLVPMETDTIGINP